MLVAIAGGHSSVATTRKLSANTSKHKQVVSKHKQVVSNHKQVASNHTQDVIKVPQERIQDAADEAESRVCLPTSSCTFTELLDQSSLKYSIAVR